MKNKGIIEKLNKACATEKGLLAIVKMDNLIMFKDVYGEDVIERFQEACLSIIDSSTDASDVKGCLGTDEFVIFYNGMRDRSEIQEVYSYIEKKVNELAVEYASEESDVSVDISVGAVMVPEQGTNYEDLFDKADKALDHSTEKNNVVFYDFSDVRPDSEDGAMWLDAEKYKTVHTFMNNYIQTYKNPACEMTITFDPIDDLMSIDDFDKYMMSLGGAVKKALRKSDVMMLEGNKIHLLLPEITSQHTISVINRIKNRIFSLGLDDVISMKVDSKMMGPAREFPIWLKTAM